ncbi:MAG: TIGR01212 family radical SAM protein [Lachnospiraceae bacterium]|jgi:radical SAM protein (TIGR01212 family)|nr:TIGR01212 family radical SAM protein [Lachnospiraceae bacterium]
MKPYRSFDEEMKRQFGKKLYRLSLNGGLGCPNREGGFGKGGCIFCSEGGSGDFAAGNEYSITEQLVQAKALIARKLPKRMPYGYVAYFQAYTGTYGPVETLEAMFVEAMEDEEVEVLSIATRPDCLPKETVALLARLNKRKPVWVELGLQTAVPKTAAFIRRGYPLSCFTEARKKLFKAKIPVIAHVILGLPGEGKEEVLKTIAYLNGQHIEGIKLQLLHILEGTDLADLYREGAVKALSFEEYEELLFAALMRLGPKTVVHRITGDGPKRLLLAPLWSGDKKRVYNRLHQDMEERGVYQGIDFKEEGT